MTVVDVIRAMGIEPLNELTWAVGNRIRDLYEARYGRLPEKDLRAKTGGGGSHCFAIYPLSMREEIEKVVREHQVEAARQLKLF